MKWHQVVKVAIDEILADPILAGIYGENVRKMGTGSQLVPGLEWMVIGDAEDELWNPITIQWDQWCHTWEDAVASEQQLRRLFHQDLPISLGGVGMWVQYADRAELSDANRDNFAGVALRFRYTPLRSKYDPVS